MSDQIQDQFIANLTSRRRPRVLYHYTSSSGLIGILRSRAVWATNIRFLNDSMEYEFALEIARQVIDERIKGAHGRFDLALNTVLHERLTDDQPAEVYVSSFTENGDQLSQWRAYCPPSGGYAIGFTTKQLIRTAGSTTDWFLAPCVYYSSDQYKLIQDVFQTVADLADKTRHDGVNHDRVLREAYKLLGRMLQLVAPVLKDPSFAEEREWRLIHLPQSFGDVAQHFREGRSMLIPYHEHSLGEMAGSMPIAELVVGPTPHMALARNAAQSLLASVSLFSTKVQSSIIPYRTW